MAHFYFHLHNGNGWTRDQEGQELPDLRTAEYVASKEARALIAVDIAEGVPVLLNSYIAIDDGTGHEISRIGFGDVALFV